jgi:hypothetical protein
MSRLRTFGRITAASLILGAALLTGCASRVPLTRALIKEYGLSTADVPQLQFYLSDPLVLEQEATSIDKDIDRTHSLKMVEDQYIKQVEFKKGTPCLVTTASADALQVACEEGKTLSFHLDASHRKGEVYCYRPDVSRRPESPEPRPSGAGYRQWKIVGKETYGDSTYNVLVKYAPPYLLVDQESLTNFKRDARVAPGMRHGE